MSLLRKRDAYKPFDYPWAYDYWKKQQQMHWMPDEVPMADDIRDWKQTLTDEERSLLTQIFRFFTQADIEVNDCYHRNYLSVFKPPEVVMMLTAFSNMETIHVAAYSHLVDTLGLPEVEYSAFMEYAEMREKAEFLRSHGADDLSELGVTLGVFGALTEGLSLFSSFAMLMNFPRFGKMKGMGQIVSWSVRDETLHMNGISKLYQTFVDENLDDAELTRVEYDIVRACRQVVDQEDRFIDLAFELGPVEGLTPAEMKSYIRYIADQRLQLFGIDPIFHVGRNPLPWMEDILNAPEHANFFEQRATEYSKYDGDWDGVF